MVGNLLGDPMQTVAIGDPVEGVFEHHPQNSSAVFAAAMAPDLTGCPAQLRGH
jgi:hypothetical protein